MVLRAGWKHPHGRGEDDTALLEARTHNETPPRAWGRPWRGVERPHEPRNTPTGVGKTQARRLVRDNGRKHPHGRGEDAPTAMLEALEAETPPRAWGRLRKVLGIWHCGRNTPTGVGKTTGRSTRSSACQKHPHGRGEDQEFASVRNWATETPPRAWGRPENGALIVEEHGNTPTGVGKTGAVVIQHAVGQKHPHGRGEDALPPLPPTSKIETPPRAWGRPRARCIGAGWPGNTPTGVGKTPHAALRRGSGRKHPHGRGEDCGRLRAVRHPGETPPRAWGRLAPCGAGGRDRRNTPTGVGKTLRLMSSAARCQKHPHGRGEDSLMLS